MSTRWKADNLVQTRSENVDRFKRNFLQQAVCELRFPTLMELGEQRPPASFVKALRKDYPHLDLSNEVTLGPGVGNAGSSNTHIFRSTKLNWTVSLKQSAISIETTSYTGFATLRERILQVIDAAEKIIDSDFFTRIGLRYINLVKSGEEDIATWINPALMAPITSNNFIGVNDFGGRIQLMAEDGGCLLQHAIKLDTNFDGKSQFPAYVLDIDTYRTEVSIEESVSAVDILHQQAFDLFDWSLTERTREFLSFDQRARQEEQ